MTWRQSTLNSRMVRLSYSFTCWKVETGEESIDVGHEEAGRCLEFGLFTVLSLGCPFYQLRWFQLLFHNGVLPVRHLALEVSQVCLSLTYMYRYSKIMDTAACNGCLVRTCSDCSWYDLTALWFHEPKEKPFLRIFFGYFALLQQTSTL